jgi:RNA polymerase sigma-70 factor (ECF subfamily)
MEDIVLLVGLRDKHTFSKAFTRIYMKYRNDLLRLAYTLLKDRDSVEDVVHDVFVQFAKSIGENKIRVSVNLKGYLIRCIVNRAHDYNKAKASEMIRLDTDRMPELSSRNSVDPCYLMTNDDEVKKICKTLMKIDYAQREVVVLHLLYGLKFRQIAKCQDVSVGTVQSRYRYAVSKIRSLLGREALYVKDRREYRKIGSD